MQLNFIKQILLGVVFMMTPCACAYTETVNGVTWTYTISDGKATIADVPTSVSGSVTIPSTLGGYPVTSIGYEAFRDCSSLTSVAIPGSVTSIEERTFYYCSSLTRVTIPESVTSIGDCAFEYCFKLTSITIPNSVTSIGDYVFYKCQSLTSVTIPDSVTSIGEWAFSYCSSLTSVTIPERVTSIGEWAFSYCLSIASVTIPDSVTSIGSYAFCKCTSLPSVTIPDSVTNIGSGAFSECSSLMSVTIGDSVTSIGGRAFRSCSSLTSVTIPSRVTSIGFEAFRYCTSLMSVTIGNSVTSIGSYAFYNCTSLTSVTIPNSVTSIGEWAFSRCSSLVSITFEGDAPLIVDGDSAFKVVSADCTVYVKLGSAGWGVQIPGKWQGMNIEYSVIGYRDVLQGEWTDGFIGVAEVKGYGDKITESGFSVRFTAEETSLIWIEKYVTNTCRVKFKWKTSCEPLFKGDPYDYLSFEVDGEEKGIICGETGWKEKSVEVFGDGIHRLRWCFQRDDEGEGGENSAWLADLEIVYARRLSFAGGGATDGNVPDSLSFYEGDSVILPNCGTLALPRHTFAGWSDGTEVYQAGEVYSAANDMVMTAQWKRNELDMPVFAGPDEIESDTCVVEIGAIEGASIHYTLDGSNPTANSPLYTAPIIITQTTTIKAIAVRDNYFDSEIAVHTVTRGVWTYGEYLNSPEMSFEMGGDAEWIRVKSASEDGRALRSGDIEHSQTSSIETIIYGPGTISFKCRV